jgi:hypothetical protein
MKTYRFVTAAHHDVFAETLEEAIEAFREMEQKGIAPKVDMVRRIEVKDKKGAYTPVDHSLRAEYRVANTEEPVRLSA